MAVDIRGIEVALVKTIRAAIGHRLSNLASSRLIWQSQGEGVVANPSHVFTANTKEEAAVLRTSYFTNNPSELVDGVTCTLAVPILEPTNTLQSYVVKPSVIRSRLFSTGSTTTTQTVPDYPYVSVDYTRITDEGYELSERYYDENDNYVYRTHKLASYSVKVFGTSENDVLGICNELHMLFETDEVRDKVTSLSPTEARVRSKSDPVFVASAMEDKYREVATFDLILAVLDEVSVSNSLVPNIENIELDTSVPVDGVQGGICNNLDTPDPNLDVLAKTEII